MKKIPTLFKREYDGPHRARALDEVKSGLEWVLAGEGIATVKVDGTCCAIRSGEFYRRYSLGDAAIARFVSRLNRYSGCKVAFVGKIVELKQQEYRGKRLVLALTDERGSVVRTKVDLGVHTREGVKQSDFGFEVVTERNTVRLLANSREQIFVEKLKSLLRFGPVSSRYKDVYDMYSLSRKMNRRTVLGYIRAYIFDEPKMLEHDLASIIRRLEKVFPNRRYVRALANPKNAWMDEPVEAVIEGILGYLRSL